MTSLPPVLWALGWSLLHFVWQAALVALALAATRCGSRQLPAELRYRLACSALFTIAALPLCTFALIWNGSNDSAAIGAAIGAPLAVALRIDDTAVDARGWSTLALPWLLTIWGCGVGLLATRASFGWLRLHRMVRDECRELSAEWRERSARLRQRLAISERVRLVRTMRLVSPIVTGCWRPVIMIPASIFGGYPPEQIEALILHELLHIKQRDLWVHRLQLVLETLFFYHPATWWISRVVHDEREFRCDAAVVEITGDRLSYARALSRTASMLEVGAHSALSSTGGPLMSRIRSIVQSSTTARPGRLAAAAWSMAAVGLFVALLATTSAVGDATHDFSPRWMPESVERWNEPLRQAAARHGIEPALLSIFTLLESHGDPDAVSPRGAIGLMQIMPQTATHIAEARGISNFDPAALRDPATNLDFGAWYLSRQFSTFGDGAWSAETIGRAAAAYNGGPERLRRHLEHGEPLGAEAERYRGLVLELWNERGDANSETLAGLLGAEM